MRRLLVLAVVLCVAPPAWAGSAGDALSPARQVQLEYMLRQDCGSCHGMTFKGGLGSPLLPEDLAGKSADALAEVVLDGIPGTPMPPWRSLLTAPEALWMIGRLREGLNP